MQAKHYRVFKKKYHNEKDALERYAINYWSGWGWGGGKGLKLALRDPNPFQQLTVTFLYESGVVVPSCRNLDQRHLFLKGGP